MTRLIIRMITGALIVWLQYKLIPNIFPPNWDWMLYYVGVVTGTYVLGGLFWLWKKLTP